MRLILLISMASMLLLLCSGCIFIPLTFSGNSETGKKLESFAKSIPSYAITSGETVQQTEDSVETSDEGQQLEKLQK